MKAQNLSGTRQHGLTASPVEKRRTHFDLQLAHLLAEGRLCETQLRGGAGEIPLSGGLEKIFELIEFHRFFRSL